MPTDVEIAQFNAAAAHHAAESGKTLDEAARDLANLFHNMVNDPIGTDIYFLTYRVAGLERAAEVVDQLRTLKLRVAKLEDQLRVTQPL